MNKVAFISIIVATFLISAIGYRTYFENGWYVQDDYMTIGVGGAGSIVDSSEKIIRWLNSEQGRFQPVRLFIFSAATHMFQEEYAPVYNFILHLANLLLLFFLLRKFNASHVSSLIILLVFSLCGNYRMIESPSAMIAGSGLNLLFILITLLFLIKAIKEDYWGVKKIFWFAISLTSYAGLIFSYEVAFPLLLVIFYTLIIFNNERGSQWSVKRYFPLGAYIALLFIYLIFFRKTGSSYGGASIVWSYDILARFNSYLRYAMSLRIKLYAKPESILFFGLYFFAIYQAVKADKVNVIKEKLEGSLFSSEYKLFAFGVIFYFSSVVLFTLNQWGTPENVMSHHVYLITVGSAIFFVSLMLGLRHFVASKRADKIYFYSMILIIFPIVILGGLRENIEHYKKQKGRTDSIKSIKYKIQSSIDNPEKIDAILIKNFTHNYYGISGMDGAYLQWFDFKKHIHSGREITSVLDNKIKFKGPLTYYTPANEVRDVDNENVEIFYLNGADKKLLAYSDYINFQKSKNLHQIDQVMGDGMQCNNDYILNALLRNSNAKDTLAISFGSVADMENFLKEATLEINGRAVKSIFMAGKDIYINDGVADTKYLFLRILSTNNKFKSYLNEIKIINNQPIVKSARILSNDANPALLSAAHIVMPVWEWGDGFYDLEGDAKHNWRWASPKGDLSITNTTQQPLKITVRMALGTHHNELHALVIKSQLWNDELRINTKAQAYEKTLIISPGKHLARLESDSPRPVGSDDPRNLSYVIENFKIVGCTSMLKSGEHANESK